MNKIKWLLFKYTIYSYGWRLRDWFYKKLYCSVGVHNATPRYEGLDDGIEKFYATYEECKHCGMVSYPSMRDLVNYFKIKHREREMKRKIVEAMMVSIEKFKKR